MSANRIGNLVERINRDKVTPLSPVAVHERLLAEQKAHRSMERKLASSIESRESVERSRRFWARCAAGIGLVAGAWVAWAVCRATHG